MIESSISCGYVLTTNNETIPTHLFTIFVGAAPGPEQMGADTDGSALVGLLQQLGSSQRTLSPQRLVVFLAETSHSLKGTDDQRDSCQLGFGVADLVLVQREGLREGGLRGEEGEKNMNVTTDVKRLGRLQYSRIKGEQNQAKESSRLPLDFLKIDFWSLVVA